MAVTPAGEPGLATGFMIGTYGGAVVLQPENGQCLPGNDSKEERDSGAEVGAGTQTP